MSTIKQSPYIIVGAGIHGLSTAYHLAQTLKACGKGTGKDIIVIDKSEIGSGASGIACGVIRNNYFQPAMRELMAHSVAVWETDPEAFSYHPVGYMQISCESMHEDVASIYNQQKAIDYKSTFIEGHRDCNNYMLNIFHDWQAQGITSVLHEESGGYANNKKSLQGLAAKAEFEGVRIISGVTVTGFSRDNHGTIKSVETDVGDIHCDYVVVAPGPWAKQMWDMLEMPDTISIKNPDTGIISQDIPMWVYWSLQEGTLGVDPKLQQTNDGKMPPVIHVDTDEPLYSDADGSLITDKMWGIYYKPDFNFGGIQGGAAPFIVDKKADSVAVDPYGPESPEFIVGNDFSTMWVSALAHCQKRFSGTMAQYKNEPSGGIGAFTPDSFPVFDVFHDNCYMIADSNHGYKMIGVGKLVAEDICGQSSSLLQPFRFSRYIQGRLHPVSNSPFPWS
ncbi:MAG: FAD-binding oxidoreductase [Porticoccaceae bacterium]|jgi:glycine/D-amino acid oxidase-like deaminating enzyme|nr:FAD-binding oxidoreductase [Porticoccaceae bacterium]MBT4213499.1 FAD-binding oxidoreductase [Porticoccaceae bacterium]MBT5071211.1 FAD-binding oxidoreductase [Porticoccaceae bacterium]MBT6780999.1 FAD-binding oxidoreductase [Porticoccaceae bacterium]MBT7947134.1 FAD-binding oxidoreductase [Porticoccaceae bacterium]|tara:strand:- start:1269 stop:2612 length:1344 start_codon:yes stop_codon:yes gene_type:complete